MNHIFSYLQAVESGKTEEYHDARDPHRSGGKSRKKIKK